MRRQFWKGSFLGVMAIVAALLMGACAAPLSQIQLAQMEYEQSSVVVKAAEQERERKESEAVRAREAAAVATAKVVETKVAFAAAKRAEAARLQAERAAQAAELERRAAELREQGGKDAAALEREAAELVPPPAQPKVVEAFVDVEISDMAVDKVRRLSEIPKGWALGVDATAQKLRLSIDGLIVKSFGPPTEGFGGRTLCWRIFKDKAEACPAKAPPPAVPVP